MDESQTLLGNTNSRIKEFNNNDKFRLLFQCFVSFLIYFFVSSKVVLISLIFLNIILALLITEYEISMIVGWGALIMVLTQNIICAKDRECEGVEEAFKIMLNGYINSNLKFQVFESTSMVGAIKFQYRTRNTDFEIGSKNIFKHLEARRIKCIKSWLWDFSI